MASEETPGNGIALIPDGDGWSVEAPVYLPDQPGELARLARTAARLDANITRFVFNRAQSPNRVELRASVSRATRAGTLLEELKEAGLLDARQDEPEASVSDPDALLTMRVRLADRPGTLAEFAELLARHDANVIFMQYDSDLAVGQVEISMVAPSAQYAQALLTDTTSADYDFHVEYRGSDPDAYEHIIGLSAAEVFFLRLRETLPEDQRGELRKLVASSDQLQRDLVGFRKESARSEASLAVSEVFENVLELAAMSLRKLGPHFSVRSIGPLHITDACAMHVLSLPTGGAHFILDDGEALTMIDTGYGLYYEDWRAWLPRMGLAPEQIRRVMLTHGDADHAGLAGYLEQNMGAEVYGDLGLRRVFDEGNRAAGSDTPLDALNAHFTRLIGAFTRARYPETLRPFTPATGERGGFQVVGRFEVGDVPFEALGSLGGHTPGQVFFLAPEHGMLFSGDYVIDFASLSDHEKGRLSVPRYLMVSTNADSRVFGRELEMLQRLMVGLDADLARPDGKARVFPGHGEPYHVDEAVALGAWEGGG